jgi:glutamate dehydrogenase/leucine dehydrogenase
VICLERLVRSRGWRREDTRVAVQGYGNAGSWLAILLQELGYPIVAVSDSRGAVVSDRGLPAADVLAHKRETGSVVGVSGAETIDVDEIVGLDCTVLALAALEESVHAGNADRLKAQVVVETANYPVTPEADEILADRGVAVVPDILASGGGVAVSYLEWVQDLQRESWPEDRVNARLEELMGAATDEVLGRAEREGRTLREAAYLVGVGRVAEAEIARGFR